MNAATISPLALAVVIMTARAYSQNVDVTFFRDDVVRIVKTPDGGKGPRGSFVVTAKPDDVKVEVSGNGEDRTYTTEKLKVIVSGGKVRFETASGKTLLAEEGMVYGKRPADDPDSDAYSLKQSWRLEKDEFVYGLGIWQDLEIMRNNRERKMIQQNVDDYVPIVQSIKGWGIFWDNASPTQYRHGDDIMSFDSEVADASDYYFMYGKTSDGVVRQIRDLTGQVPMQPKWTLGYYISKERYVSWQEDIAAVKEHRRRGIPLDCVVQDWRYWGENDKWNDMSFRPDGFADPEKNIAKIHDLNAKLMIVIWPGFGPNSEPYKAFKDKGWYFKGGFVTWPDKDTIIYDAFNKDARDLYWKFVTRVRDTGPDAWWMDSTEPDHFVWNKESFDGPTGMGSFRRMCNAFPLFTVGGIYDHQRADEKGRRRVSIMTRSCYAGQQRTGANTWSGDVISNWENFRKQIAAGISFGMTGNPNYNTDIGGFFPWEYGHPEGARKHPGFVELHVRWMQYALFNPIFRSHGTGTPREIWQFADRGDRSYEAMVDCVKLRYRFLPYLYSVARWVSDDGGTWMRPLFADYLEDAETRKISNQFLFGTELLAAPVVESLAATRRLYLPRGTVWYDFFTGRREEGGRWIEPAVELETIPLYAKAGAIVPMGPEMQYVGQISNPHVDIKVFPGADGAFVLYDDAGDGYQYEEGEFSEIDLKWNDAAKTLVIGARRGSYPGMAKERDFIVTLPDGASRSVRYCGEKIEVRF